MACGENRARPGCTAWDDVADEEAYAVVGPARPRDSSRLRFELHAARGMASTALALALVSSCLVAAMTLRLPVPASARERTSLEGVVGLSSAGARGWHRTYLESLVREGEALDSKPLQELPVASLVYIAEAKGGRVHILKPTRGWMSWRTEEGVEILRPDMTYAGSPDATDLREVLRSRKAREANARTQATVARFTAVQRSVWEAMAAVKRGPAAAQLVGRKSQQLGAEVMRSKAPRISSALARGVAQALRKVGPPPRGGEHLLGRLAREPRVRGFLDDKRVLDGSPAQVHFVEENRESISAMEGSLGTVPAREGQPLAGARERAVEEAVEE